MLLIFNLRTSRVSGKRIEAEFPSSLADWELLEGDAKPTLFDRNWAASAPRTFRQKKKKLKNTKYGIFTSKILFKILFIGFITNSLL